MLCIRETTQTGCPWSRPRVSLSRLDVRGGFVAMSGVGAAILEPQGAAERESVRVYLSQSVLPAITEALSVMEKEKCPNCFAALR